MGKWYGGMGFFILTHGIFEHISKIQFIMGIMHRRGDMHVLLGSVRIYYVQP